MFLAKSTFMTNESADSNTAQKMKFSIRISSLNVTKLQIWSHLLKKSIMENFIFLCSESTDFIGNISLKTSCRNTFVVMTIFLYSLDTGLKSNIHKTFMISSERLVYVQFTFCVQGIGIYFCFH